MNYKVYTHKDKKQKALKFRKSHIINIIPTCLYVLRQLINHP